MRGSPLCCSMMQQPNQGSVFSFITTKFPTGHVKLCYTLEMYPNVEARGSSHLESLCLYD
uniref:Uncharacterized protein n=1 Tax=Arion vulgaris TaxID=1028688 RepID=A0A0B7B8Y6_9EUPU